MCLVSFGIELLRLMRQSLSDFLALNSIVISIHGAAAVRSFLFRETRDQAANRQNWNSRADPRVDSARIELCAGIWAIARRHQVQGIGAEKRGVYLVDSVQDLVLAFFFDELLKSSDNLVATSHHTLNLLRGQVVLRLRGQFAAI
jgi:hypothetical protein